jgi:threonine/homoserine/homoserine lactone efflux protein
MFIDYVPSSAILLQYSVACFILFITPGPDMSLWLAKTLTGGRSAGIAAMIGTNLGCFVHSILASLGISVLIQASPFAFNVMKVVGALYLLWMAYSALRQGSVLQVDTGKPVRAAAFWPTLLMGLTINLTNPKVVLFFVTFLPLFIDGQDPHASGKLLFLGFYFILFNIPLSLLMILAAERMVGWLKRNPRVMRWVDYTFAGVFGFFALTILRAQARH